MSFMMPNVVCGHLCSREFLIISKCEKLYRVLFIFIAMLCFAHSLERELCTVSCDGIVIESNTHPGNRGLSSF